MTVLVDSSVWSLILRRKATVLTDIQEASRRELLELVRIGEAGLIGGVRQELLTGIRDGLQYQSVRRRLRQFAEIPTHLRDYEVAAARANDCRAVGIQGSAVDFQLCAVAERLTLPSSPLTTTSRGSPR